jgi:hypothetical protein
MKKVTYVPLGADPVPYSEVEQHMKECGFTYAGGYKNGTSDCCGRAMSTQLFTEFFRAEAPDFSRGEEARNSFRID